MHPGLYRGPQQQRRSASQKEECCSAALTKNTSLLAECKTASVELGSDETAGSYLVVPTTAAAAGKAMVVWSRVIFRIAAAEPFVKAAI